MEQTSPESAPALRPRSDGWTPEIQVAFVKALAESGCVRHAAESVGRLHTSAYKLRARPDCEAFREAWRAASRLAYERLRAMAVRRAEEGLERRTYDAAGNLVSRRMAQSDKLLMYLLDHLKPPRREFESAYELPPSEFYMAPEDEYGAALLQLNDEPVADFRPPPPAHFAHLDPDLAARGAGRKVDGRTAGGRRLRAMLAGQPREKG